MENPHDRVFVQCPFCHGYGEYFLIKPKGLFIKCYSDELTDEEKFDAEKRECKDCDGTGIMPEEQYKSEMLSMEY